MKPVVRHRLFFRAARGGVRGVAALPARRGVRRLFVVARDA